MKGLGEGSSEGVGVWEEKMVASCGKQGSWRRGK